MEVEDMAVMVDTEDMGVVTVDISNRHGTLDTSICFLLHLTGQGRVLAKQNYIVIVLERSRFTLQDCQCCDMRDGLKIKFV